MAEIHPFRESTLRQETNLATAPPRSRSDRQGRFRAYDRTGQRFISNDVEIADASAESLDNCLSSLTPGSGAAVWINPIRTLSATSFRFPVDLLYMREDCSVLEAVCSFPIGRVSSSTALAASILALPAHAVVLSGIKTGDELLLCSPEEMEQRLLEAYTPSITVEPQLIDNHAFGVEQNENTDIETISSLCDRSRSSSALLGQRYEALERTWSPAALSVPAPCRPEEPEIAPEPVLPPTRRRDTVRKKTWWQKLFPDEPEEEDDRQAPRIALPGPVAYFFTDGAPVAHRVRNISTSGVYVLTLERWYKGTVVRITLTDEREPTTERSITLHGMVARSTDDGVALQFITEEEIARNRRKASPLEHLPGGSSTRQISEFIASFKSRP